MTQEIIKNILLKLETINEGCISENGETVFNHKDGTINGIIDECVISGLDDLVKIREYVKIHNIPEYSQGYIDISIDNAINSHAKWLEGRKGKENKWLYDRINGRLTDEEIEMLLDYCVKWSTKIKKKHDTLYKRYKK